MSDQQKAASFRLMLTILGIGLLAAITTIYVGHTLCDRNPGFMGWMTIGFLCLIEFLATILMINGLFGKKRRRRPSGAILLITYGVLGAYAVLGLVSIIGYSAIRDGDGSGDSSFVAILIAETVLAFIAVAIFYAYDFYVASSSQELLGRREHHAVKSRSLKGALVVLNELVLTDAGLLQRRDVLVKKLRAFETALGHSHGGGVGSREGGWQHPLDPGADQAIDDSVSKLNSVSGRMVSEGADVAQLIAEMERTATGLHSALNSLQLM
jgi:hypothetical protein